MLIDSNDAAKEPAREEPDSAYRRRPDQVPAFLDRYILAPERPSVFYFGFGRERDLPSRYEVTLRPDLKRVHASLSQSQEVQAKSQAKGFLKKICFSQQASVQKFCLNIKSY